MNKRIAKKRQDREPLRPAFESPSTIITELARSAELREVEHNALAYPGVLHAFAQAIGADRTVFLVVSNDATKADREKLHQRASTPGGSSFYRVQVITAKAFNKAVRAALTRNYELEAAHAKIKEVFPEAEEALTTLDVLKKEPETPPLFAGARP